MDARLIIDPPAPGPWNMAVDEALFQGASSPGFAVLRLYQWSQPTLSLGYFQSVADRKSHSASWDIPLVRRTTGGGAIVHDRELTYSLSLHLPDDRLATIRPLVKKVHQSLIDCFHSLEIAVAFCVAPNENGSQQPFLCFQRRTDEDLVLGAEKVVGSAQRKLRHALLQHGSILLQQSAAAPELPGLQDLTGQTTVMSTLLEDWPKRIGQILQLDWVTSGLSPAEAKLAARLEQEKFHSPAWNEKR